MSGSLQDDDQLSSHVKVLPTDLAKLDGKTLVDPRTLRGNQDKRKEIIDLALVPPHFGNKPDKLKDSSTGKRYLNDEKAKKQEELMRRVRLKAKMISQQTVQPQITDPTATTSPPTPQSPFTPPSPKLQQKLAVLGKYSSIDSPRAHILQCPPTPMAVFPSRQLSAPAVLTHDQVKQVNPPPQSESLRAKMPVQPFPTLHPLYPPPSPSVGHRHMYPPPAFASPLITNLNRPPPNFIRSPVAPHPALTPSQKSIQSPGAPPTARPALVRQPLVKKESSRDPRLAAKLAPPSPSQVPASPEPQMGDPSRQQSLSKIMNSMNAFTSYNVIGTSRLSGSATDGAAKTADQPPKQFLFEKPVTSLPSPQQLFAGLSTPSENDETDSEDSANQDQKKLSDDQLMDELMSKRRTKWPSSWVVAKSGNHVAAKQVPDEEEIKKQLELDQKTIALRLKFGVKKKLNPNSNPVSNPGVNMENADLAKNRNSSNPSLTDNQSLRSCLQSQKPIQDQKANTDQGTKPDLVSNLKNNPLQNQNINIDKCPKSNLEKNEKANPDHSPKVDTDQKAQPILDPNSKANSDQNTKVNTGQGAKHILDPNAEADQEPKANTCPSPKSNMDQNVKSIPDKSPKASNEIGKNSHLDQNDKANPDQKPKDHSSQNINSVSDQNTSKNLDSNVKIKSSSDQNAGSTSLSVIPEHSKLASPKVEQATQIKKVENKRSKIPPAPPAPRISQTETIGPSIPAAAPPTQSAPRNSKAENNAPSIPAAPPAPRISHLLRNRSKENIGLPSKVNGKEVVTTLKETHKEDKCDKSAASSSATPAAVAVLPSVAPGKASEQVFKPAVDVEKKGTGESMTVPRDGSSKGAGDARSVTDKNIVTGIVEKNDSNILHVNIDKKGESAATVSKETGVLNDDGGTHEMESSNGSRRIGSSTKQVDSDKTSVQDCNNIKMKRKAEAEADVLQSDVEQTLTQILSKVQNDHFIQLSKRQQMFTNMTQNAMNDDSIQPVEKDCKDTLIAVLTKVVAKAICHNISKASKEPDQIPEIDLIGKSTGDPNVVEKGNLKMAEKLDKGRSKNVAICDENDTPDKAAPLAAVVDDNGEKTVASGTDKPAAGNAKLAAGNAKPTGKPKLVNSKSDPTTASDKSVQPTERQVNDGSKETRTRLWKKPADLMTTPNKIPIKKTKVTAAGNDKTEVVTKTLPVKRLTTMTKRQFGAFKLSVERISNANEKQAKKFFKDKHRKSFSKIEDENELPNVNTTGLKKKMKKESKAGKGRKAVVDEVNSVQSLQGSML